MEYIIEKLLEEKVIEGVWKVLVKWKEYIDKLSQSVTDSKKNQPEMIRQYMDQISKKKT